MPISPEAAYCLDGGVDCLDYTADIEAGARLMRLDVDGVLDGMAGLPHGSFAARVHDEVAGWMRDAATLAQRRRLALAGVAGLPRQLRDLKVGICHDIATLYLRGKGVEQPNADLRCLTRRIDRLAVRNAGQALDPVLIRRFILLEHAGFIGRARLALPRWCEALRGAKRYALQAALLPLPAVTEPEAQPPRLPEGWRREPPRTAGRAKAPRAARRALVKGVKRYQTLFGDGIRAFIAGQDMHVSGALYDYRLLRTRDNLVSHTAHPAQHAIPYHLTICSKQGIELGSGCVVFPDTPILDQVIALSLHVRERETEIELLRRTVITATPALADDPVLRGLRPKPPAFAVSLDAEAAPLPGLPDTFSRFNEAMDRLSRRPALREAVSASVAGLLCCTGQHRALLAALPDDLMFEPVTRLLDVVQPLVAEPVDA